MTDHVLDAAKFIDLTWMNVSYLFIVGFIGGLVSGFIGSGGAFVLTPAMMSLGVPGAVAVASNMCHKFPKAMVGAYKRYKYGQVDLKLGVVMAVSATVGVQIGIKIQEYVLSKWGESGSNLYVSLSFVLVLIVVGGYVFYDAWKSSSSEGADPVPKLARTTSSNKSPAHDPLQDRQLNNIVVVHHSGRSYDRHAGGHHCGWWVRRGSRHDLCCRGFRTNIIGFRVGHCVHNGVWRNGKVGDGRNGRHKAYSHNSCWFAYRCSAWSYRYHLCERAHDKSGYGNHNANRRS